MQLAKVYLIHERSNEEDTTTRPSKNVFRCERVWDCLWIETRTLVCDFDGESVSSGFEGRLNCFIYVVGVPVKDGVNGGLADGHGDVSHCVFVETGANGAEFSGLFNLVDSLD